MSEEEPKPDSPGTEAEQNNEPSAVDIQRVRIAEAYRQALPQLLGWLQANVGSRQEAQDIAQEACMRLMAYKEQIASPKTLLWKAARNIAIDRGRAQAYRHGQTHFLASDTDSISPSPEPWYVAHQRLGILARALAELPAQCRKAFTLVHFQELSFEDAAAQMRIHSSGVRKHVARAMEHCQRAIDAAEQQKRSGI